MRTRVKICGVTTPDDAAMIARLGADAVGVVFAESKRRVDVTRAREIGAALPLFVSLVGVFMDQPSQYVGEVADAVPLDFVQLHGTELPTDVTAIGRRVIKRLNVRPGTTRDDVFRLASEYRDASAILLDPGAGDGKTFDWSIALGFAPSQRLIISGGLTPANVGEVVRLLRPMAVDVASGVERSPGVKDEAKVRAFLHAVRSADADCAT